MRNPPIVTGAIQSAVDFLASLGVSATRRPAIKKERFNREHLPTPESFWGERQVKLSGKKGWASTNCILHEDNSPSMRVNTESGAFFCHSCGAKGGDVLAAYMLMTGADFVTAAKALGAWEEK
jgi:hypothetical protein